MMNYMLAKLETQMRQSVSLQKDGDFPAAAEGYELIFETLRFYEEQGFSQQTENLQKLVLEAQTTPEMALYFNGLILFHLRHYTCALESVKAALTIATDSLILYLLKGRILTSLGDFSAANAIFARIQEIDPAPGVANDNFFLLAAEMEMPGADYYDWLRHFHFWLKPASYVEVGLGHGRSLALAEPGTKAIGIDPYQGFWERLNYICPHGPATLFPLTSDDFFAQHDLRDVLERETFDLGFIDGLHLFEQALKDFINLERYARQDSVILIHDCLPIAPIVAERERCTGFWTGDVWRIIPCLKTFRPDLKIMTIPTKPSGLGVVTNLDATSTVLRDNYDEIVRYYLSLRCPESFEQRRMVCSVGSNDEEYIRANFCGKQERPNSERFLLAATQPVIEGETMNPAFTSGRTASGISNLSAQEIASITLSEPNQEERAMLDSLNGIEGLILEKEALALFRICKQLPHKAKILEIGSYQGGSTLAMGHAIAQTDIELYCLDPWSNYSTQEDFTTFERSKVADDFRIINNFIKNTSFIGENLRMLRGKSSAFGGLLAGKDFDLIFIDGAHDYASVRNDITIAFSALKPGGFVCGHDYHSEGHGVKRAVNELIAAAPSIENKGKFDHTDIWYGVIAVPYYEYRLTGISDLMDAGRLIEALEKAYEAYAEFKNTELLNYIAAIKQEISRQR